MPDIENIRECPDCASTNIVHNLRREQVICKDCGLIYEPMTPVLETRFERAHGTKVKTAPAKKTVKKPAKKAKKKAVKKAKKKTAKKTKRKRR